MKSPSKNKNLMDLSISRSINSKVGNLVESLTVMAQSTIRLKA